MKRFISNKYILFLLGSLLVIALWFLCSLIFDKNGAIFPSPILVIQKFGQILTDRLTYVNLGYSFLRILIGFGLSFVLALLLGILAGNHQNIYDFFKPLMTVLKSIPTVALIFVLITLSNARDAPIYVVMVICFPILYEGVAGGVKNVDKGIVEASKVDGAGYFKSVLYVKLPLAIPYILVSVMSSFALSFKIEIMAEVITGSTKNSLGSVIHYSFTMGEMDVVFAYALLIILFILLISTFEEIGKAIIKQRSIVIVNNN